MSYVDDAIAFAKQAVADKKRKRNGEMIIAAAKRFLNDIEEAKSDTCPFVFSPRKAEIYCKFIEKLPHVEGKWKSKTLVLEPAQLFALVQLFGFRDRITGNRRFTTFLFAVARKNAKSTLAAAILIACWVLEGEQGAQVLTAATTGSQARIVWGVAKKMIEKCPALMYEMKLRPRANDILCDGEEGGIFKPINAKASTQDGLNPTYTALDELHAHESHELLNVLMSAAGARECPLWMYTTTEGYENPGPWSEQRNFAEQVLRGIVKADHYLAIIFRIDDDDDDFDESKWIKANPLMEANPLLLTENRKLAIEAKSMPGRLAEFRIKRLNRRASVANGFIDINRWLKCAGKIDLKFLEDYRCWAALDLANNQDLNAWRLLWDVDGVYYSWGRYWVPQGMVNIRTERNTVPYAGWAASGWMTITEGDSVDHAKIKEDMLEDYERFAPVKIAYDPWNALQLATELDELGLPMIQFIQGTKSYNPAMKFFERMYLKERVVHEGSPVLLWNMANLLTRKDANNNIAPDRKRAKDKIDGAVATMMTFGLAELDDENTGYVTYQGGKSA